MIESEISKNRPYLLNDDFIINPTEYTINGEEDLVISYTSSKQVTGAIAMIKEWKYAKSFTSKTITFANSDFAEGVNEISVVDVNYSDGTYGRFTGGITVVKKEAIVPPPVVDNPPTISQDISNVSVEIGKPIEFSYIAVDDNEIVNHEFYNGTEWSKLWPTPIGDTYYFTLRFDAVGIKYCKVKVTDIKGQIAESNTFSVTVNEVPVVNTPPSITINSTDANYNGEYSIKYTLSDNENDNMQVSLKIDNGEYSVIASDIKNGIHTYRGSGLKEGSHNITLKVFDGVNTVEGNSAIIVPAKPIMSTSKAILYDKTGLVKLGDLDYILDDSYSVEEERNGMFDLMFEYPNGYPLADQLIEENFVEVKPNDEQGNQKFRIYSTKKFIDDIVTVFARHESFDLANDHVENINLPNASCEYALNTLFRNSHFSKDFRGYSDIVNAQDFAIDNVNILNAIAGKEGSIIDTYGTGAEILRDGKNIHVLNKRGHDNEVTIEYGKNLTGFELVVDLEGLETRCGGFAKYKPSGSEEEVVIKSDWIDSPFINNFSHPYISVEGRRDYSDKFKDGAIPTKEALNKLCQDEFKINKRDIPASNYKINFIPLSKCVGYEGVEDKISLCDTVTIVDPRFNINTKAKVIKYKYDFIKERYISMELGEPRTTLGDIIGGNTSSTPELTEEDVKDIIGNTPQTFPNTLPPTPILTAIVKGFASIDLSWTYEDKVYYTYEVYASKTKDFTPNTFDLIHEGQTSSFLFQAKPNETWYFRVCAKNTHGERTDFSPQVTVTTKKADDFDKYFSSLAVGNLVTNIFSADYMEAGIVKGHWIDAKNLSVTDGNGKRTFDIDSFGNVVIDSNNIKTRGQDVASVPYVTNKIDGLDIGGRNYLRNASFLNTLDPHQLMNTSAPGVIGVGWFDGKSVLQMTDIGNWNETQYIKLKEVPVNRKKGFIISLDIYSKTQCTLMIDPTGVIDAENRELNITATNQWIRYTIQLPPGAGSNRDGMTNIQIYAKQGTKFTGYITDIMIEHGNKPSDFDLSFEDLDVKANEIATKVNSFEEQITPDALKRVFSTEFYTKDSANSQFASKTEVIQNSEELRLQISKTGGVQMIPNGDLMGGAKFWSPWQGTPSISIADNKRFYNVVTDYVGARSSFGIITPEIYVSKGVTYTVGCLVSGNINALNYNYLMEYRDGQYVGKQRIDDVTLGDVSNYYKRISITFKAEFTGPAYVMFGNENYQPQGATFRIGEVCCYEGSILYPFKPNESANYVGDVYFDITGMGMKHEDGSISRITSKAFELSDTLGRTKVSMKRGNYHIYHPDNGHLLGFISGDGIMGPEYRGVNFSMAGSSHYLALGNTSSLNDEENFAVNPIVTLAYYDLYNTPYGTIGRGINFQSLPCVFHEVPLFKKFLYTPQVASSTPKLKFCAKSGSLDLNLMTLHGDDQEMTMGCPIRMNGHPITGAPVGYSVINSRSDIELFDVNRMPIESKDIFDEIKVVKSEFKCFKSASNVGEIGHLDVSSVTNKDEIMLDENSADLGKLVTILFKKVKEQDEKNKNLENIVNELVKAR
ncbi:Gp14 protein [[Clostridium] sordellii]|uniref:phage tail spike protein n=1 Tax=Paraclostridium sordellii TaxID=1505 RepID=UPI0005DE250C|nr:phage tail spike protein [Paeniclostridium sordellii]CEO04860.1 Gp14 protein [[Clostridium] sordellii] [Paeniclostridium sordellii]